MTTIKVLGTGCQRCETTVQLIEEGARRLGIPVLVRKVTDITEIMRYGAARMPAIVVRDRVIHAGSVPSAEVVSRLLAAV